MRKKVIDRDATYKKNEFTISQITHVPRETCEKISVSDLFRRHIILGRRLQITLSVRNYIYRLPCLSESTSTRLPCLSVASSTDYLVCPKLHLQIALSVQSVLYRLLCLSEATSTEYLICPKQSLQITLSVRSYIYRLPCLSEATSTDNLVCLKLHLQITLSV